LIPDRFEAQVEVKTLAHRFLPKRSAAAEMAVTAPSMLGTAAAG